jgi:hypothetical protein
VQSIWNVLFLVPAIKSGVLSAGGKPEIIRVDMDALERSSKGLMVPSISQPVTGMDEDKQGQEMIEYYVLLLLNNSTNKPLFCLTAIAHLG